MEDGRTESPMVGQSMNGRPMTGLPARLASGSHAEHELRELRPLLTADEVNEVVINPDGAVWVERADADHMIRTGACWRSSCRRWRRGADGAPRD
jgi:hypothetical protein